MIPYYNHYREQCGTLVRVTYRPPSNHPIPDVIDITPKRAKPDPHNNGDTIVNRHPKQPA